MKSILPYRAPLPPGLAPLNCAQRSRGQQCRASNPGSPGQDDGSSKRDSLYGSSDSAVIQHDDSTAVGSSVDSWPEAWREWLGSQEVAEQPISIEEQQQAGASPATAWLNSPSPQEANLMSAGMDGSSTGGSRFGRRSSRRLTGRQPGGQQREYTAGLPTADGEDPWVQAELRQMRRRQRRQTEAAGSASQPAGSGPEVLAAQLADPWAQEWGPLEGAPIAAAEAQEDFGWGAESWAGSTDGGLGARQGPQGARLQTGLEQPGSSWELAQQQRQLRRRRRQAAAARAAGLPGPGSRVYSDTESHIAAEQQAALDGGGDAAYTYSEQQHAAQGQYTEDYGDGSWSDQQGPQYNESYEPGVTTPPNIAVLSPAELDRVLPVVPFSQQAAFYNGSAAEGLQRWGASLAATVVLSKVALLAATSLTWPLWWPWALAAKNNLNLRRQYRYGGLWRTQILDVSITGRPNPFNGLQSGRGSTMRMARVLVGDEGGARTQMILPYDSRYELIRAGEAAELIVLSRDLSFQGFKAVKDVYLPNVGLWVSEYPHADRTQLLEVSLQVEREAQQQQQQQYADAPAGMEASGEQQQSDGGQQYGDNTAAWQ